jgi:hypothetical protein
MMQVRPLVQQLPGRMGWEIRLTVQGGLRILERIRARSRRRVPQRPVLGVRDWLRIGGRALRM